MVGIMGKSIKFTTMLLSVIAIIKYSLKFFQIFYHYVKVFNRHSFFSLRSVFI